MSDSGLKYCIFNRDGSYEATCLNEYESPSEYTGVFTGWECDDREKAEKVAYVLNHLHDPLAIKYFMEMAGMRER